MGLRAFLERKLISPDIDAKINALNKPLGSMGYDPWGFHSDTVKMAFRIVDTLYHRYFRVDAKGVENVPAEGPVVIIANHSGQLPLDGILVGYSLVSRKEKPRMPRAMIERFFPTVPYLGNILNQMGAVLGDPQNCAKMLENDEAVIIFPEGIRGSGKMYRDRYQLKRFGNGFMHLAMKYNATVVPVGVVGCEETIPALGNLTPVARALGVPYVPVAAPVVLPARVFLRFGEPMHFPNDDATDEEVTARVDKVKKAISGLIDQGLSERERLF